MYKELINKNCAVYYTNYSNSSFAKGIIVEANDGYIVLITQKAKKYIANKYIVTIEVEE